MRLNVSLEQKNLPLREVFLGLIMETNNPTTIECDWLLQF